MGFVPFNTIHVRIATANARTSNPIAIFADQPRLPSALASTEYSPAPVNSRVAAPMDNRNGTLKGCDQKAPCETLTAQAQIMAPTTAHADSGVNTPRMSPI